MGQATFEVGDWIAAEFETHIPVKRGSRHTFHLNQLSDEYFIRNPKIKKPKLELTKVVKIRGQITRFDGDLAIVQARSNIEHVPINQLQESEKPRWAKNSRKGGK